MSNYITTYTRRHFDPVNPEPADMDIKDIAHALSMICRGNGHVSSFWSVGEHCILCAKEAAAKGYADRLVLAALLHDASECYMSDVPRPLKQNMKQYKEQENHLLDVLYTKFLGTPLSEEEEKLIKEIDNELEERQPKLNVMPDYTVRAFSEVEKEYLEIFKRYKI